MPNGYTYIIIKNILNAHFSKLCFLHIFRTKSCIKENKNIHLAIKLRTWQINLTNLTCVCKQPKITLFTLFKRSCIGNGLQPTEIPEESITCFSMESGNKPTDNLNWNKMKQCYTLTELDVTGKICSYIRLMAVAFLCVTLSLPASAQGGGEICFRHR